MRFIDTIEPAGEAETVCIQVAAADSLYVTDDFLVTHNTLNDSFIILDEAQNTTPEQMKMFLTRLGFDSKMVVTGDITQIDLPRIRSPASSSSRRSSRGSRASSSSGSGARTSFATAWCSASSRPTTSTPLVRPRSCVPAERRRA